MHSNNTKSLILASSSPYRKELLAKLHLPFETASPDIDESPKPLEKPEVLAKRLAQEKAFALAKAFPGSLIIGSDQVAMLGEKQLSKPGNRANAIRQLQAASAQSVIFYTSVCVLDSKTAQIKCDLDKTIVQFRELTLSQIENYVDQDQPFNCAAAFKSEGFGISLLEKMQTEDPSALIGLPLIRLIRLLEFFGVKII